MAAFDRVAAIVVAAGLSSRMGAFKPMLPFGSGDDGTPRTLIEASVACLQHAGIEEITCVVGLRADELRPILDVHGVRCVVNPDYASTQMFDSLRIGLEGIASRCDAFFLLPGDMPAVRPQTLRALLKRLPGAQARGIDVLIPLFSGQEGHPPLILQSAYPAILTHDGHDGLRGAFETLRIERVPCPDAAILMDADTPDDYDACLAKIARNGLPTLAECEAIWDCFALPADLRAHQEAVATLASETSERLIDAGVCLDVERIRFGALLHDIAKKQPHHAEAGAIWLRDWGFTRVSDIVLTHTDWPLGEEIVLDERAIVHWADKRIQGTQRCSIEKRFDDKLRGKTVHPKVERRRQTAYAVEDLIRRALSAH